MANYNRYNRGGGSDRGLIGAIVAIVLAGILAVVAIINWDGIKTWFKSLGSGSNVEAPAGDEDGAGNSGGTSDDFSSDDFGNGNEEQTGKTFTFERTILRYNAPVVEAGYIDKMSYEFNMPYELALEVSTNPNKLFKMQLVDYATYQNYMSSGYTTEDMFQEKYDSGKLTLNFDSTSKWTPDFSIDQYGRSRCVIRNTATISYDKLNTRYVPICAIATKNGDNVTFECADYGDRGWDDWSVSPSLVYLSSSVLNQMTRGVLYVNGTMRDMCIEVINKGAAQAQGVAEADYVSGNYRVTLNTSDVITVKVGETKKISVVATPSIDLEVVYFGGASEMAEWTNYTITPDGYVTGLKAGTYTIYVDVYDGHYAYTLQVVE